MGSSHACIGYPEQDDEYLTSNSADYHAHLGFSKVGEFRNCGYKFSRWYHMIWMEKIIGAHKNEPPMIVDYPTVVDRTRIWKNKNSIGTKMDISEIVK